MALTVDDRLRHAQDRLESLLHVLDQPACFLQLMRELAARLTAVVLQDIGIHAIDAQLRQRVGVETRHPDILDFLHYDVGYDVARLGGRERGAGTRVEALDQSLGLAQLVVSALQRLPELRKVAGREELEVLVRDGEGRGAARRGLGQGKQLQLETFRAIARTHARGVEILQVLESDLQLLGLDLQFLGHELRELLHGLREIAAFVQRFDQERDQIAVARLELGQSELPVQILAQIGRFGGNRKKITIIGVVACTRPRTAFAPPVGVSRENVHLRWGLRARVLRGRLKGASLLAIHVRRGCRNLAIGVFALEQRIFGQKFLELLIQFHGRELQQAYRLLQLRRPRQVLRKLEL